ICVLHHVVAIYSAYAVDSAMVDCLLLDQEIKLSPRS
ncbi:hypothetical protein A2U01_0089467, partial [Trifolium medium]|nr:hypothetical protein [Trifolium medium]